MPASRRRNGARACNFCFKAHLPCDHGRPCSRCVLKGCGDRCQDAPRKKKKYLEDVPQVLAGPAYAGGFAPLPMLRLNLAPPAQMPLLDLLVPPMMPQYDAKWLSKFLLTAAGMEYLTMSLLIHETNPPLSTPSISTVSPQAVPLFPDHQTNERDINQYALGQQHDDADEGVGTLYPDIVAMLQHLQQMDPQAYAAQNANAVLSLTVPTGPPGPHTLLEPWGLQYKEQTDIYTRINKPYGYTLGYHALIGYLRQRFSRDMLVGMALLIAKYRPLFIAATKKLTEPDLVFMEQCFQRTLLEYDRYIGGSGTPTIVWRRTAQVAYVGHEFCMLTGWLQQQLLGKPTFVVELMDDASVLEYFKLFLKIAFGDFRGATMTECTLISATGTRIRTACIWTLKRDVFGIPMMIVGNFLPILGDVAG